MVFVCLFVSRSSQVLHLIHSPSSLILSRVSPVPAPVPALVAIPRKHRKRSLQRKYSGFGLGYELKVANAETGKAIEDARVGGTTAHVIEAPSELQVESRRRRDGEGNASTPQDFVNKDNQPVRTDRSMDKLKLTSELPDDVFSELERLKVEGPTGSINFKVQGFARFSAKDASRCGSVVIVYTTMGHVQFDGTSMLVSIFVV